MAAAATSPGRATVRVLRPRRSGACRGEPAFRVRWIGPGHRVAAVARYEAGLAVSGGAPNPGLQLSKPPVIVE